MLVRERFEAVQVPHRVAGTTTRDSQVIRNDKISAVYNVREATGSAFLIQSELVHVRMPVSTRATPYELECLGPLVAELPARASKIQATAQDLSGGGKRALPVRTGVASVRLPPSRPVQPARRKQLVLVELPRRPGSAYDNYRVELAFRLPKAPLVRERVVYTARISCGGSSYLQPMVPLTNDLGFVNAFTVPRDGKPFEFILPHIATGISSHGETTQTLECGDRKSVV